MEKFKSPETGREYTSEFHIDKTVKENALFVERLEPLEEMRNFSQIPSILLHNEKKLSGLNEFEAMLGEEGRQLSDLLKLRRRHPAEQKDAEEYVQAFFNATSQAEKEQIIGWLARLMV